MLTPFSGLSLIIHLIVIGFASVSGFLFKKKENGVAKKSGVAQKTLTHPVMKSVLSIFILIIVSSVMLLSFAIAVKTGFHEGVDEPQITYVREGLQSMGTVKEVDAHSNNLKSNKLIP